MYSSVSGAQATLLAALLPLGALAGATSRSQPISGDVVLQATVSCCDSCGSTRSDAKVFEIIFDAVSNKSYASYLLDPAAGTVQFRRTDAGNTSVLQTVTINPSSWRRNGTESIDVELLRRGTFFLLYIGGFHETRQPTTYVQRPMSEVRCTGSPRGVSPSLEPLVASVGVRDLSGGTFTFNNFRVTEYRFEDSPLPIKPVLTHCSNCGQGCDPEHGHTDNCWAYNQVIPGGGLLQLQNGTFVLYVAGQDYNGNDGGGKARMGVATGPALDQLSLHPDFVLEGTAGELDERSVFPNGALQLENGTIVVTYMGQANNDSWGGIFLATSSCAVGCPWTKHGVVLGCHGEGGGDPQVCNSNGKARPIHEHDLIRLPNKTFIVFYAGNTEAGDAGFLASSDDLLHWTNYPANPALPLPLQECGRYPNSRCWDGEHRRPRSLFYYKEYWYLLYEGTTQHPASLGGCWGDTIGLMRSTTLEGPYLERHPLQIMVPSQPGGAFDSTWTGWPRAHLNEQTGELQVLYAAGGRDMQNASSIHDYASTGLRHWPLGKLTNWSKI